MAAGVLRGTRGALVKGALRRQVPRRVPRQVSAYLRSPVII